MPWVVFIAYVCPGLAFDVSFAFVVLMHNYVLGPLVMLIEEKEEMNIYLDFVFLILTGFQEN